MRINSLSCSTGSVFCIVSWQLVSCCLETLFSTTQKFRRLCVHLNIKYEQTYSACTETCLGRILSRVISGLSPASNYWRAGWELVWGGKFFQSCLIAGLLHLLLEHLVLARGGDRIQNQTDCGSDPHWQFLHSSVPGCPFLVGFSNLSLPEEEQSKGAEEPTAGIFQLGGQTSRGTFS